MSTPVMMQTLVRSPSDPSQRLRDTVAKKEQLKKQPGRLVPAITVLVILLMVITLVIRGRGSRGICQYDHVYRKVTCKSKLMQMIPGDITDAAITLHMGSELDKAENFFTTLKADNFSRFQHLQELQLIKCGIEDIQEGAFRLLTALRRLDLRYNRLQVVSEDTFKGLTSLEYLYLSNNPIHSIGDFVFRGLRIETLVLGNNPALTEISNKAFAGAIIRTLIINRCSLSTMGPETLTSIADSLQELYITHNLQPLALPENALKGLKLSILGLVDNGLTDTEYLEGLSAVEINLDENPLEEFDCDDDEDDECPQLVYTKRLSLRKTKLTRLTKENLSFLTNLEVLDLDGNDLTVFNASVFEKLDKLRELDLSDNDLVDFEGNFSQVLPNLQALFLDGNEIQTIPSEIEPLFSRLDNMTLHQNPLHCNCEIRWFVKWLETHRQILQDVDSVKCETPESRNLTHISDYGFQCRPPTIFNATFHTDGISLLCTAEGDPAPRVTWVSPNGAEKTVAPSRSEREVFQTQCSLTITKDGNYTCVAFNVAGQDRITINTREMPTSGLKFVVQSQEIELLESSNGFMITSLLIMLLAYIIRRDSITQITVN